MCFFLQTNEKHPRAQLKLFFFQILEQLNKFQRHYFILQPMLKPLRSNLNIFELLAEAGCAFVLFGPIISFLIEFHIQMRLRWRAFQYLLTKMNSLDKLVNEKTENLISASLYLQKLSLMNTLWQSTPDHYPRNVFHPAPYPALLSVIATSAEKISHPTYHRPHRRNSNHQSKSLHRHPVTDLSWKTMTS